MIIAVLYLGAVNLLYIPCRVDVDLERTTFLALSYIEGFLHVIVAAYVDCVALIIQVFERD